tara:strand:+ start:80 stop:616 length:537 start_codon:yes stop_codon:yes gene_type:complete
MHLRRLASATLVALGIVALSPASVLSQSQIAGHVTDSAGDGLPGVTVEASSPVLVEGSRIWVTDLQGNYTIVDLTPGTYGVTFTLPGFRTQVQGELELHDGVTTTIDMAMTIGVEKNTRIDYGGPLKLTAPASLQFLQSDTEPGREVGGDGIIMLCEPQDDGTIGLCRPTVSGGRLFR